MARDLKHGAVREVERITERYMGADVKAPVLLWNPLLAATIPEGFDLTTLPYPLMASPKLDGVRAMVQNGVVVSRGGLPFRNKAVQELWGGKREYEGLDGELIIGSPTAQDVFNRSVSAVKNSSMAAYEEVNTHGVFHAFDRYTGNTQPYSARLATLSRYLPLQGYRNARSAKRATVLMVPQVKVGSSIALLAFETKCLKQGYEGVMVRDSALCYIQKPGKENRSMLSELYIAKLKRFDYGVARIVEVYPLRHNKNEDKTAVGRRSTKKAQIIEDTTLVGSVLLVDDERSFEFCVSIAENKLRSWTGWAKAVGTEVRYKFQSVGTMEQPRFPTCRFTELGVE